MSRFEFEHFERFVCVLIATNGALLYPSRQTWVRSQAASSVDSHVPENDRARSRGERMFQPGFAGSLRARPHSCFMPEPQRRLFPNPRVRLCERSSPRTAIHRIGIRCSTFLTGQKSARSFERSADTSPKPRVQSWPSTQRRPGLEL